MNGRGSYQSFLTEAYRKHRLPKEQDAPTVISLFAGCGGSSLGYSMAGFRELLAVEWDGNAVETFRANFADVPVWHGDVCSLSVGEILQKTELNPGELDVLDGSPPCQGFSTAGRRIMDDDRNQLFREYVRILAGLRPKIFVMENVSGMVKGKMKLIFADIMRELKNCGYSVSARLMNAMYFNVPQSRERMIFIGMRNDTGWTPSHPRAEANPVSAAKALEGVTTTKQDLTECRISETWQMYRVLKGQEPKRHFGLVRISLSKPFPTIVKDAGNTSTGICHPEEIRKLSIPEIKRAGSFPDEFVFLGNYKEKWARIGNSVPPLFMKAIAEHLACNFLQFDRPRRDIDSPSLP